VFGCGYAGKQSDVAPDVEIAEHRRNGRENTTDAAETVDVLALPAPNDPDGADSPAYFFVKSRAMTPMRCHS
jgi:hypothetical protein